MNRAMVALKPFPYAGNELKPGDTFTATPVDGDYFIRCKTAADVVPEVAAPEPFFAVQSAPANVHAAVGAMQAEPAAVDNQGSTDVEPVAEAAPAAEESEAEASGEDASDEAEEDAEVTPRRRGRPRKAV
jgi:hypothetical protein